MFCIFKRKCSKKRKEKNSDNRKRLKNGDGKESEKGGGADYKNICYVGDSE